MGSAKCVCVWLVVGGGGGGGGRRGGRLDSSHRTRGGRLCAACKKKSCGVCGNSIGRRCYVGKSRDTRIGGMQRRFCGIVVYLVQFYISVFYILLYNWI